MSCYFCLFLPKSPGRHWQGNRVLCGPDFWLPIPSAINLIQRRIICCSQRRGKKKSQHVWSQILSLKGYNDWTWFSQEGTCLFEMSETRLVRRETVLNLAWCMFSGSWGHWVKEKIPSVCDQNQFLTWAVKTKTNKKTKTEKEAKLPHKDITLLNQCDENLEIIPAFN